MLRTPGSRGEEGGLLGNTFYQIGGAGEEGQQRAQAADAGDTKELGSSSRRSKEQLFKHSQPEVVFLLNPWQVISFFHQLQEEG